MKGRGALLMLAAGGTGGHLFPAQALAEVLRARGHDIHLVTDERVRDYGKNFPASQTHIIPSASLSFSKPLSVPGNALTLLTGVMKARSIFKAFRPAGTVGFGGYPTLPPLWAAATMRIPYIIHEQNAVLGRANKLLAGRANAIATSFENIFKLPDAARSKVVLTGNPVRQAALHVAGAPYPPLDSTGEIRLVVFGGSQGAKFFSDIVPDTLKCLDMSLRNRLSVTQQCRDEDMQRVRAAYAAMGVKAKLSSFFANMPEEIAGSHLVICRSGASSIAELGVIGRPAILVPLPHAIDNDQLRNAESFQAAGAGFIREQAGLSAASLAQQLEQLLAAPQALKEAALLAKRHGKPDAAQKLADLVEQRFYARGTGSTGDENT